MGLFFFSSGTSKTCNMGSGFSPHSCVDMLLCTCVCDTRPTSVETWEWNVCLTSDTVYFFSQFGDQVVSMLTCCFKCWQGWHTHHVYWETAQQTRIGPQDQLWKSSLSDRWQMMGPVFTKHLLFLLASLWCCTRSSYNTFSKVTKLEGPVKSRVEFTSSDRKPLDIVGLKWLTHWAIKTQTTNCTDCTS